MQADQRGSIEEGKENVVRGSFDTDMCTFSHCSGCRHSAFSGALFD